MLDIFLLAVLVVVLVLGMSILVFHGITGVPPLSSSSAEIDDVIALLKQAPLPEQAIVYELGCGYRPGPAKDTNQYRPDQKRLAGRCKYFGGKNEPFYFTGERLYFRKP